MIMTGLILKDKTRNTEKSFNGRYVSFSSFDSNEGTEQ